ncbi:hypothetical protein VINE108521_16790 [Vibrio neonatus]
MSDYSYFCSIDLAKSHFSLHAVDQNGKLILHKSVTRSKLLTTICSGQQIPDTILSRFSAVTGETPSFA